MRFQYFWEAKPPPQTSPIISYENYTVGIMWELDTYLRNARRQSSYIMGIFHMHIHIFVFHCL